MKENISMWSIILPSGIALITAYCIYQQQKHHLKINLFIQTINDFRKLTPNHLFLSNSSLDSFLSLSSYADALLNQSFYMKFVAIDLSCFAKLNLERFENIYKSEVARKAVKGYEDKVNAYNYISVLQRSLFDSIDAQIVWIGENGKKLKGNALLHSDEDRKNISSRYYTIEGEIHSCLSELELMAIQEEVSFIRIIRVFLKTSVKQITGYKNKLLDWHIKSKNER